MRIRKNSFIPLLLAWAVLVSSTVMAEDLETPQERRTGETHFIVFAPNQFDHLHNAPEFQNGMRKIAEQLAHSGLPEGNIVLLHGQADARNRQGTIANLRRELERLASVYPEDRIVLFALTHGINVGGNDYLADQRTTPNGFLSGSENEVIAVSEIVRTLGASPAEHKWVLIDTASFEFPIENVSLEKGLFVIADPGISDELLARYSDEAFGMSPLSVPNNFVVSINRGRRIHRSIDEGFESSIFLRSFVFAVSTEDRFHRHGQQVLLQETLNTMNRFLSENNHPAPAVSGTFSSNALLLANRAPSAGLIPISPEMWEFAIAQEIETASKLIMLYYRPQDAIALLRQTEIQLGHLQRYGEQFTANAQRVRVLRRMAQAMLGEQELRSAWEESQRVGDPFFLYVVHGDMVGRLVPVASVGTTTTTDPRTRQQTRQATVEHGDPWLPRIESDPNSPAQKLAFRLVRRFEGWTPLPINVFILGDANPVSPFLESVFNREEFE